jgi:hypothetical protein
VGLVWPGRPISGIYSSLFVCFCPGYQLPSLESIAVLFRGIWDKRWEYNLNPWIRPYPFAIGLFSDYDFAMYM